MPIKCAISEKVSDNKPCALTPRQAIEVYPALGTLGTLANWRAQSRGPRFFKRGRSIYYKPEHIEDFLFSSPVLTRDSFPDEGGYPLCAAEKK